MKRTLITLSLLVVFLAACNVPASPQTIETSISSENAEVADAPMADEASEVPSVSAEDEASIDQDTLSTAIASIQTGVLTEDEAQALLFMREEEKLARDTYLALYDIWQLPVFQNIAASEQTHTDAVKTLIDRYGLEDAFVDELGVFVNQDLQDLYDSLVSQGSQSIVDALKVGGAIEEIDILDLKERVAQTDKADIILVYENLLKGSRNHLRAFVTNLQNQTGEVYTPQYMDVEAYQAIISSGVETGNPRRRGQGN
ncbi:MAG: DUF2202 domain-containing protein [Anaerolineaceae bacterium]|nr:DUF2202 domain-containing protein [Anaerolineaceae bacterium]